MKHRGRWRLGGGGPSGDAAHRSALPLTTYCGDPASGVDLGDRYRPSTEKCGWSGEPAQFAPHPHPTELNAKTRTPPG